MSGELDLLAPIRALLVALKLNAAGRPVMKFRMVSLRKNCAVDLMFVFWGNNDRGASDDPEIAAHAPTIARRLVTLGIKVKFFFKVIK